MPIGVLVFMGESFDICVRILLLYPNMCVCVTLNAYRGFGVYGRKF